MKRTLVAALLCAALGPSVARAADHLDGPAVKADPTTDITDLYTWMSGDGTKVYLVMDVLGGATGATAATKFSNSAVYAFHVDSAAAFGGAAGSPSESQILCTFTADATQKIACWGPGGEYVTGDASGTSGITSASGKLQVFAGLRDDPFFFNLRGFKALTAFVHSAAGLLKFDAAGCPAIDAATSAAAVGLLASDGANGPGKDDFAAKGPLGLSGNVLSIVVGIDAKLVTPKGKFLSVWASTNQKQ